MKTKYKQVEITKQRARTLDDAPTNQIFWIRHWLCGDGL